jgi:hypothetical protein
MSLKASLDKFQDEFSKAWNRYIELDKELMVYRGVEITRENVEAINRVVVGLQECYAEMYEALMFVSSWTPNVSMIVKEHQKFMDDIKAAGGVPDKKEEHKEKEAEA